MDASLYARERLPLLLALSCVLSAGCGDDSNSVMGAASTPTQSAWIGTYPDSSGQADVVLDLTQTGMALAGEVVFGSTRATHLWVTGTSQHDSIFLAPDPAKTPSPIDFSLRTQVLANGSLSGTIAFAPAGLNADLSCQPLTRRSIDTDATRDVPFAVIAMVYDGAKLWLSTVGDDYIRMDPNGAIVDTIAIYHNPPLAHWMSSVLMYDGALLWGEYPITIMGPGGPTNVADLLAFTASGRAPDSLRIEHRSHGLAHDGVQSWSLRSEPAALIQFDGTGAVTDSLHLAIPDASQLAFDGTHFWTLGWYMRRLYEVDTSGQVIAVCDLPQAMTGSLPSGLTVEGSYLWYSEGGIGASILHRMTIR